MFYWNYGFIWTASKMFVNFQDLENNQYNEQYLQYTKTFSTRESYFSFENKINRKFNTRCLWTKMGKTYKPHIAGTILYMIEWESISTEQQYILLSYFGIAMYKLPKEVHEKNGLCKQISEI